jgi:hypothetical protein
LRRRVSVLHSLYKGKAQSHTHLSLSLSLSTLCEDVENSIEIRVSERREGKSGKGLIFGRVGFTLVFFFIYWVLEFFVLSVCIVGGQRRNGTHTKPDPMKTTSYGG